MILPLAIVMAAVLGALVAGRSFRGFPSTMPQRPWLALAGLVLQVVPTPGDLDYVPLVLSFAVLLVFVGLNVRLPGFILLTAGVGLNLLVIASNLGMPVTRDALETSGQSLTVEVLAADTKHRLATPHTVLRPLGDAIGLPPPIGQVVSAGDLLMYVGLACFVVSAMPPKTVRASRTAMRRPRGASVS